MNAVLFHAAFALLIAITPAFSEVSASPRNGGWSRQETNLTESDPISAAAIARKLLQDPGLFVKGGHPAPEGRFSYACSLRETGTRAHGCGGTLVGKKWVLTAAHCVSGPDSVGATPVVYVGAHGIDDETAAEVIPSVKVFVHEGWTGNGDDGNDIALLLLERESTKMPVRLPDASQQLGGGQIVAALGWGRISDKGPLPSTLQVADDLEYVKNSNCLNVWSQIKDNMLCAHATSQGTCQGDSGGPLVIPDERGTPDFDLLVGLVSFGPDDCGSSQEGKFKPGVYTRVSSFRQWIDEKMGSQTSSPETSPPNEAESPAENTNDAAGGICREDCDKLNADLYNAAGSGDLDKVKELLSKGADPSSTHRELKFTPLHFAAEEGHVGILEMLIGKGADIDAQNDHGSTALYYAAQFGQLDAAKALVRAGAIVDLERDTGATPLIMAAQKEQVEIVEFLLESEANVDAQQNDGATALYLAAQFGQLDAAKALVRAGATVDLERDTGGTPLIISAQEGKVEVAGFLLESGANVDAQNNRGSTALSWAGQVGHLDVAKVLVEAGETVDLERDNGATPLIIAAEEGKVEVLEFLLKSGANVNARNDAGGTPLHLASYVGNPELIQMLLDNGAEIDAQSESGLTPAFVAASFGSVEAIEVLKNAGADLSIMNSGVTIEDAICVCLKADELSCREGTCGEGEIERLKKILND